MCIIFNYKILKYSLNLFTSLTHIVSSVPSCCNKSMGFSSYIVETVHILPQWMPLHNENEKVCFPILGYLRCEIGKVEELFFMISI